VVDPQEARERIEEAGHERSKRVAILIAVLAAALAFSETGGKNAESEAVAANIAAADTWAFYQAKTIRMSLANTAADALAAAGDGADPAHAAKLAQAVDALRQEASRLDSDAQTQEGRRELAEEAQRRVEERNHHMARYHHFEYASAALQLAIVLASAAVITGVALLAWTAGALGLLGACFCLLGWFAPHLIGGVL
jgi:Domain of unknown function (DUF4337)